MATSHIYSWAFSLSISAKSAASSRSSSASLARAILLLAADSYSSATIISRLAFSSRRKPPTQLLSRICKKGIMILGKGYSSFVTRRSLRMVKQRKGWNRLLASSWQPRRVRDPRQNARKLSASQLQGEGKEARLDLPVPRQIAVSRQNSIRTQNEPDPRARRRFPRQVLDEKDRLGHPAMPGEFCTSRCETNWY